MYYTESAAQSRSVVVSGPAQCARSTLLLITYPADDSPCRLTVVCSSGETTIVADLVVARRLV